MASDDLLASEMRHILAEIGGREVFAWLPVRLVGPSGFFGRGWAWLRPVLRKRYIGFPSYFHTEIESPY